MDIELLTKYIIKARKVMEIHHNCLSKTFFGEFPRGACGNTSDILSEWIQTKGVNGIKYVYGKRDGVSHGWLEIDGLIIDITSDQFEDGMGPVYIGKDRKFHDTFLNQNAGEPQIASILLEAFSKFCELMEQ